MGPPQIISVFVEIHFILSEYTKGMKNIGKKEENF